jgi:hypothetical protein
MGSDLDKRKPRQAQERSQTPLWFVAGGLAIALYSRSMKDEMIGDVVFLFGLACAVVALLYWFLRPRHGL